MRGAQGPCREATWVPESQPFRQDPREDRTVDLGSAVAAEGDSCSNLATAATGKQTKTAEGNLSNLTSNHSGEISDGDSDLEIVSHSYLGGAERKWCPGMVARSKASVSNRKSSALLSSSNVNEKTDRFSYLTDSCRQNLKRKNGQPVEDEGEQKLINDDAVLSNKPQNVFASQAVLEEVPVNQTSIDGTNSAEGGTSFNLCMANQSQVEEGGLGNAARNDSGTVNEDSDVEAICNSFWGISECTEVQEHTKKIDLDENMVSSGMRNYIMENLHKQVAPITNLNRYRNKKKQIARRKQIIAPAGAGDIRNSRKNKAKKQKQKAKVTHSAQISSPVDLSHLSKSVRRKLRNKQRLFAQAKIAAAGNADVVPSSGEGELSNTRSDYSLSISGVDSDLEILSVSSLETDECVLLSAEETGNTEVSHSRDCSSFSAFHERSSEVPSDKAEDGQKKNSLNHENRRQNLEGLKEQQTVAAHSPKLDNDGVILTQGPENEPGSEGLVEGIVNQIPVDDVSSVAEGEAYSCVPGETAGNPTAQSTVERELSNLEGNCSVLMNESDSDVEIVIDLCQKTPDCIEISDSETEMDVNPTADQRTILPPSVPRGNWTDDATWRETATNWSRLTNKQRTKLIRKEMFLQSIGMAKIQQCKLLEEQAAAMQPKIIVDVGVILSKSKRRILNNALWKFGIDRGRLTKEQNIKLRPLQEEIAYGKFNIKNSEALRKFVAEVRGQTTRSVRGKESVRTNTDGGNCSRTANVVIPPLANVVIPPQGKKTTVNAVIPAKAKNPTVKAKKPSKAKHCSAKAKKPPQKKNVSPVEERISKYQESYQTWLRGSEPYVNKNRYEDDEVANDRRLIQYMDHQVTLQNLLSKGGTKFVVEVPVFNTRDEEAEFMARYLKNTESDSLFQGPDGQDLPPDSGLRLTQQSHSVQWNSNLPLSKRRRIMGPEMHKSDGQLCPTNKPIIEVPNPPGSHRVKSSSSQQLCNRKVVDSIPNQSHVSQITENCTRQNLVPLALGRNCAQADQQLSTETSQIQLQDAVLREPCDSLHGGTNAHNSLDVGESLPITLEPRHRTRSPRMRPESSRKSRSIQRSHELPYTTRSPQITPEDSDTSISWQTTLEGSDTSNSSHRSRKRSSSSSSRSSSSRSSLRHEKGLPRSRKRYRSCEDLRRCTSPFRSCENLLRSKRPHILHDTLLRGRTAVQSGEALININLL